MKKITLLLFLITSIGYAQINPIDFESSGNGAAWAWNVFENDANPALEFVTNPDASGINTSTIVAKITALQAGEPWVGTENVHGEMGVTFTLDATNTTVKIMVYKSVISDVGIKFATPAGGAQGELKVANTKINEWEELTFNFSSYIGLGDTSGLDQVIVFPDFDLGGRTADNVVYFDNITFSASGGGSGGGSTAPIVAAPTPTHAAGDVISIYSDAYTDVSGTDFNPGWGQATIVTEESIAGNNAQLYSGLNYQGIGLGSNQDVSSMNFLHIDYWTENSTALNAYIISPGPVEKVKALTVPTSGGWTSVDIPLSDFSPVGLADIFQFKFDGNGDVYLDNIYFYSTGVSTNTISLPIDFETNLATTDFIDFDGGTATVLANAQSGGINTSAMAAQIVRDGGQVSAGSKVVLANNIDFSTLGSISMKVFTTASVGTVVKFKLEGNGSPTEIDALTTVSGEWETLTWDFTGQPADFNTLVFMFDFGNTGNGSVASTFLFDDIMQIDATGGLSQIDLPVDFEGSTINYAVSDFGDNQSTLIVDPEDGTNTVIKTIKPVTAPTWAGTTIGTGTGFATNLPLTLTNSKMNVRVWSPDAGTPIRLKAEDANDNTHTVETEVNTTVAGGWETIEFDFSNEATGTAALEFGLTNGWVYNKVSIFFNFGTDGATAGEKTYYFDDVKFGRVSTASLEDLQKLGFKIYPNPASEVLFLTAASAINSIEIFDIAGRRMLVDSPNSLTKELSIRNLSDGIYFVRVTIDNAIGTTKIIKR